MLETIIKNIRKVFKLLTELKSQDEFVFVEN